MRGPAGRFAPSPSGRLHLGNLACSLLAWLSARSAGGRMVLRLEDLDPDRCRPEYCVTASDKALAVGGGVLEAILSLSGGVDKLVCK